MRVSQHLYIFKYFKSLASVASCDFVALLSHLVCPHCWPRQRSCAREPLQMIDWESDRRGGCWLGRVRTESSTWRRRPWEARRELSGMRRSLPWNTQVRSLNTMDCYNLGEWTVFPLTESEVEKNIGQVHQLMGQSLQRKDSYQTATLFVEMFYIFYSHINGKMDWNSIIQLSYAVISSNK